MSLGPRKTSASAGSVCDVVFASFFFIGMRLDGDLRGQFDRPRPLRDDVEDVVDLALDEAVAPGAFDLEGDRLVGQSVLGQRDGERAAGQPSLVRIELPEQRVGLANDQVVQTAGLVVDLGPDRRLAELEHALAVFPAKVEILLGHGVVADQHLIGRDLVVEPDGFEGVPQSVGELASFKLVEASPAEIPVVARVELERLAHEAGGLVELLGLGQFLGPFDKLPRFGCGPLTEGGQHGSQDSDGTEPDDAVVKHGCHPGCATEGVAP